MEFCIVFYEKIFESNNIKNSKKKKTSKKGNNSNRGQQTFTKITSQIELIKVNTLNHVRIWLNLTVFFLDICKKKKTAV